MRLQNYQSYAEITSEESIENKSLLIASLSSYSPRSAGITIDDSRRILLYPEEAEEFAAGVLRDVRIARQDKWAICKLIACWLSGEIPDEAVASRD